MGATGSPRCPECGQPPQITYLQSDGPWALCIAGHKWRPGTQPAFTLGVRELIIAFVVALVLSLAIASAASGVG